MILFRRWTKNNKWFCSGVKQRIIHDSVQELNSHLCWRALVPQLLLFTLQSSCYLISIYIYSSPGLSFKHSGIHPLHLVNEQILFQLDFPIYLFNNFLILCKFCNPSIAWITWTCSWWFQLFCIYSFSTSFVIWNK